MYCLNGTTPGYDDSDTNAAVQPLFQVSGFMAHTCCATFLTRRIVQHTKEEWWFHHVNDVSQDFLNYLNLYNRHCSAMNFLLQKETS